MLLVQVAASAGSQWLTLSTAEVINWDKEECTLAAEVWEWRHSTEKAFVKALTCPLRLTSA